MTRKNQLYESPPYAVEAALKTLGAHLRTARLRRNLTIQDVAEKIGTGPRAIADAEKGKVSTGIGISIALLWVYGLEDNVYDLADPVKDEKGAALARASERERSRHKGNLENDF